MKKLTLILLLAFVGTIVFAQQDSDKKEIIKVIQSAYVDGLQNQGEIEDIEKGFHPGFNLLVFRDDMVSEFPIYNWVEVTKRRKADNPDGIAEDQQTTCEYEMIDITGTAAIAKINLYKAGMHIYTDYLSLYKFKDGWKIVGKIYYQIPPPPPEGE